MARRRHSTPDRAPVDPVVPDGLLDWRTYLPPHDDARVRALLAGRTPDAAEQFLARRAVAQRLRSQAVGEWRHSERPAE